MTTAQHARWKQYMYMIAELDWAVEGGQPPEGTSTTRQEAITTRNVLVKMAAAIN